MRIFETPPPPLVGAQLRQLRARRGLSLKQVAEALGTSVSTIHRYESGWDRFEMRTLERLAAALRARLEIRLEPVEPPAAARATNPAQLVRGWARHFWDVDLTPEHFVSSPQWVLRRILQYGTWEDVHQARAFFGDPAIRGAIQHRSMDARTRRLWQVVLGVEAR